MLFFLSGTLAAYHVANTILPKKQEKSKQGKWKKSKKAAKDKNTLECESKDKIENDSQGEAMVITDRVPIDSTAGPSTEHDEPATKAQKVNNPNMPCFRATCYRYSILLRNLFRPGLDLESNPARP